MGRIPSVKIGERWFLIEKNFFWAEAGKALLVSAELKKSSDLTLEDFIEANQKLNLFEEITIRHREILDRVLR